MTDTPNTPIQPPNDRDLLRLINERLERLEQKVDERLHDTRPMWEALNNRLSRIETELRDLNRSLRQLQLDNLRERADFDERLRKLEEPHA